MAHSDDSVAQSGEQKEKITIAFLVLAWTFVLLRIWTRTYVISNFGWDDSTMILATVSTQLTYTATTTPRCRHRSCPVCVCFCHFFSTVTFCTVACIASQSHDYSIVVWVAIQGIQAVPYAAAVISYCYLLKLQLTCIADYLHGVLWWTILHRIKRRRHAHHECASTPVAHKGKCSFNIWPEPR